MSKGGVYVYRTRKPGARLRIPFLSYHWGYVGETSSFYHRDQQHLFGLGKYATIAKPWADLEPRCYRIGLPNWKWLRRSVETLVILALWPVYNHQKNQWNPRRIPLHAAKFQRAERDHGVRPFNLRLIHVVLLLAAAATLWMMIGRAA